MDISESLREPFGAALIAACATAGYIHIKAKMNNEGKLELSSYTKPAILNGILVYFIVAGGIGAKEKISADPY
jgi:hypothetical protein